MRIGIQTWGSHGDIRPVIALAKGLQKSGHQVSLIVTSIYESDYSKSIDNESINFKQVATPVVTDRKAIDQLVLSEKNPVKQAKKMLDLMYIPAESEMYEASEQLCQGNDIVIGHFFLYTLQTAAESSNTPYISIMTAHNSLPTQNYPPSGLPKLGKISNQLFWKLIKLVLNKSIKPYVDELRSKHGLEKAKDLVSDVWCSKSLNLISVSQSLCKLQSDWDKNIQICGFLNMPNMEAEGEVTEQLQSFINSGSSPVYINFGSAISPDLDAQKETVHLLKEAVKLANCRAIIQVPLWEQCNVESTQDIYYLSSAPHHLIFPKCKMVIHHGGAGTTQTALVCGRPSIIVAHAPEQEFWGRELRRLGVGANCLLRRKVTPVTLSKAITLIENSPLIQQEAIILGRKIQQEDGVAVAVELINDKFKI